MEHDRNVSVCYFLDQIYFRRGQAGVADMKKHSLFHQSKFFDGICKSLLTILWHT